MNEDTITIVGVVLGVLALISAVARFYARHIKKAGFKFDDWLIVLSIIAMIIMDVMALLGIIANPEGPEVATVETQTHDYDEADQLYTKIMWALTVVYFFTVSSTKLSILLMYRRLFRVSKTFNRQLIVLCVIVMGFWIGCTIANLTNCIPMKYVWVNSLSDPRYCFNFNHFWFAAGLVESLIDVLIFLLPITVILKLQLTRNQKIAIIFVFLLGALVIISGLIKAGYGYIPGSRQPSFSQTQLWATVHICTGIICASLPVCWPLITRMRSLPSSKWSGATWIRKYRDYYASRRSSKERTDNSRPRSDESVNKLTNNFTSRGFEVTFGDSTGRPQEDGYLSVKTETQITSVGV